MERSRISGAPLRAAPHPGHELRLALRSSANKCEETPHDHRRRAIRPAQADEVLEEAARTFASTAPKYKNLPGLIRKYYLRSEDGRRAGGVYLWETKAAAQACYSGEWKERVQQVYGSTPEILWFDTPVVVDNLTGATVTRAA